RAGGGVRQLPRGRDVRRHPAELVLRQLEVADRTAELLPLNGIRRGRLEGRLRDPRRTAAGLEAAGGEPLHLEVEALPLALLLADQVLGGNEPALEAERERVHAAVAGRRVRLAVEDAAAGLALLELVTGKRVLRHDEERQPARPRLHVGIGAREEREHVRPAGEGAPRLGAAQIPAAVAAL